MKIGDAFPSQYLKTPDLDGHRALVTIAKVVMEEIAEGERKPVVYFRGKEKGLVLNKTNANSIADIARTDETDRWTGVSIVLYPDKTDFQGKRVGCIRVDPPRVQQTTTTPTPAAPPPPPPEEVRAEREFEATDSDVPF